jgi:Sec-independent protein secretion pathway component TatC
MYIGTHASSPAIAGQAIRPLKNKLFSDENNKGKKPLFASKLYF